MAMGTGRGTHGKSYYETNFASRLWRKGLAKMVAKLLPQGWEGSSLLDIGTGDGYTIRLVKPEGPVVGIDTDPEMAEEAGQRGVEFRVGSAYKVPFPDNSFDLVTMVEVVEHLDRPDDSLAEVRRVLRPGGCAVVTTPVPKASWRLIWWAWTRFGPGKRWDNTPHVSDLRMWGDGKSGGLAHLLQDEGFVVEETATCNLGYVSGVRARKRLG
jgi:SAM-dependent methyltransferase